jgi:hypothetical protein
METYLWDKWKEINELEINRGEKLWLKQIKSVSR